MPDRAKIMKGLEICTGPSHCYDGCPHWSEEPNLCDLDLMKDALALLREQDQAPAPRLLTLEEVRALPVGTIVFEQFYNGEEQSFGSPLPAMKASRDTLVSLDGETALDPSWAEPDGTGSYFRWWSAKPED